MSYSFNVRAASKALAKEAVAVELEKVVANQPSHRVDHVQALAAASAFIDVLANDDARDVSVSVNGSVGWSGQLSDEDPTFSSASVSVSAYLVARETA